MQQTRDRPSIEPTDIPHIGAANGASTPNDDIVARLREEIRIKADGLARVSHELRTPLNSILGYTELLLNGIPDTLPTQSREYVDRIRSSVLHQIRLVNEILHYAKLESDEQKLVREECRIALMLEDLSILMMPELLRKHLRFEIEAADPRLIIQTDVTRVRQILINLLWNAIKYTDAGWVRLSVELEPYGISIAVADSGVGIEKESLPQVFRPFWRGAPSGPDHDGNGLGLAVSQRLAQSLDGHITVKSEVGNGSTFRLFLPCRPSTLLDRSASTASVGGEREYA
jgi:signal transduction histidine kinase